MAYSGEGQLDRLGQRPQSARKTASAPARALTTREGLIGTTLVSDGVTIPEMRHSRAEQSLGSTGKSSSRQAPSNTSAGVTSSKVVIPTSSVMSRHKDDAQSPGESTAKLDNMVNIHTPKLNAFDGYRLRNFNPAAFAGLFLITLNAVTVVFGAAVFFGWLASVVFQ